MGVTQIIFEMVVVAAATSIEGEIRRKITHITIEDTDLSHRVRGQKQLYGCPF
jgi:hypothetical protein